MLVAAHDRWSCGMQEGLPAFVPQDRYRYVLLDIWFLTVTRRSVALGAKAAALTFTALQARPTEHALSGAPDYTPCVHMWKIRSHSLAYE